MEFNPLLWLAVYWEPQCDGCQAKLTGHRRAKLSLGEKGSATRGSGREGTPNSTFLSRVGDRDLGERTLVRILPSSSRIPICGLRSRWGLKHEGNRRTTRTCQGVPGLVSPWLFQESLVALSYESIPPSPGNSSSPIWGAYSDRQFVCVVMWARGGGRPPRYRTNTRSTWV